MDDDHYHSLSCLLRLLRNKCNMSNKKEWSQQMKRFSSDGWLIESECSCWYLLSLLFVVQDRRWAYDNQLVWRMGIWQWDSFKVGRQIKEETNKQYVMQISFQTVMWWERMVSLIGARKQIDLIALQHNTYWILNMPTSIWLALKQDITRRKDKPSNNTLHRN